MGMRLTAEQDMIMQAFLNGDDLVVIAGAGTGKTSTLVALAEAVAGTKRGIYTAFNKKVITDAAERFPAGVQTRTAHSLAYASHGRKFAKRLNPPRGTSVPNVIETAEFLGVYNPIQFDGTGDQPGATFTQGKIASLTSRTIRRFTSSADFSLHAGHVPWVPEIQLGTVDNDHFREVILRLAEKMWADLANTRGALRFNHDVYRKLWQLSKPRLRADFLMLDEAQDTPPVLEDVFTRQTHLQRIAVGDPSQQIYAWTGAVDALNNMDSSAKRLYLTQSWRFGPQIAAEANKWLEVLNAPIRLTGNPALDTRIEKITDKPDAVMCRTNVGAFGRVMHYLEAGHRVHMVGGGAELAALARSAEALMDGRQPMHADLAMFSTWDEAVEAAKDEDADGNLRILVNLIGQHGVRGVLDVLNRLCEARDADVIVCTAHKGKGSEYGRVLVADDFPQPDEGKPIKKEDANLAYVTVTRAQAVLDRGPLSYIDNY